MPGEGTSWGRGPPVFTAHSEDGMASSQGSLWARAGMKGNWEDKVGRQQKHLMFTLGNWNIRPHGRVVLFCYCFLLLKCIYNVVLESGVQQCDLVIYNQFFSIIGYYKMLRIVPCAIQQVLVGYLFYIQQCVCESQTPNLPLPLRSLGGFLSKRASLKQSLEVDLVQVTPLIVERDCLAPTIYPGNSIVVNVKKSCYYFRNQMTP